MATILAVDDRAINREFLATLLTSGGHTVLQAGDGVEALEVMHAQHPDLVITDVLMPNMDGVEFADRVHESPDIAHTPIIFYTATYRLPEAKVLAASCHVSGVLAKPAEPQLILATVAQALGVESPAASEALPVPGRHGRRNRSLPDYLRERIATAFAGRDSDAADAMAAEDTDPDQRASHALNLRMAALLEFDLAMASERDAQTLVELLCRAAQDILLCKYAAVVIFNDDLHTVGYAATQGFDDAMRARFETMDPSAGIFSRVMTSDKPYLFAEAQAIAVQKDLPDALASASTLLIVPIRGRASRLAHGWLYVADKRDGSSFNGEQEQFALTLTTQFSLTFGNLLLYDQIQQHAARLQQEIAERQRAQEELAYSVTHDQTTGLPRFSQIESLLQAAVMDSIAHAGRVMVFYLDIDRFHVINETRGRDVGDSVLRSIAARLAELIGEGGQLSHMAADEFVLVVVDTDGTQDQVEFGEIVRRKIEEPIVLDAQNVYVTCSIGASCFPDNGTTPQELLRQAEAAMMRAKQEGRNAVYAFDNEHKKELEQRRLLGMHLRDAIREGQFVLNFQPQISGQDWQILGFEALLRWQSPVLGWMSPGSFLAVAEELGLAVEIGHIVLKSACRQIKEWVDAGAEDFCISVNISSIQLQRPDFVDEMRAILTEFNVSPTHLELEVTESMVIGNVPRVIETMRAMKTLGIKIALDDFGTGYSSLNYLRQFPIDTLKIDQSFVHDITSDAGAAGICRAIITLGHQLGLTVIAEGVETAAQVGYLRRNQCDCFQGYYFSKPVTAAQAFSLLEHRYMEHEGLVSQPEEEKHGLLLLDDEENILNALNRALRRGDYQIYTATTAEQAFDILARNNVEVIISDQRMPGMSGTEFLSKVKEMYPDTLRIMLSGYTDLAAVTEAINRGAIYKFLIKPWDDEELRMQIREAFRVFESRAHEAAPAETETNDKPQA